MKSGYSNSLWDAVKIAEDTNILSLPKSMYVNENLIPNEDLQDCLADFFEEKKQ